MHLTSWDGDCHFSTRVRSKAESEHRGKQLEEGGERKDRDSFANKQN